MRETKRTKYFHSPDIRGQLPSKKVPSNPKLPQLVKASNEGRQLSRKHVHGQAQTAKITELRQDAEWVPRHGILFGIELRQLREHGHGRGKLALDCIVKESQYLHVRKDIDFRRDFTL
jgi:hypothetical protein